MVIAALHSSGASRVVATRSVEAAAAAVVVVEHRTRVCVGLTKKAL